MPTIDEYHRRYQHVKDHGPNRLQVNIFLSGFALASFVGVVSVRKDIDWEHDPQRSNDYFVGASSLGIAAVLFLVTTLIEYRAINTISDCDDNAVGPVLDGGTPEELGEIKIGKNTASTLITRSYLMHHRGRWLMLAGIFLALGSMWLDSVFIHPSGGWVMGVVFLILAVFYRLVGRVGFGID